VQVWKCTSASYKNYFLRINEGPAVIVEGLGVVYHTKCIFKMLQNCLQINTYYIQFFSLFYILYAYVTKLYIFVSVKYLFFLSIIVQFWLHRWKIMQFFEIIFCFSHYCLVFNANARQKSCSKLMILKK
jgi:hypothetical protein